MSAPTRVRADSEQYGLLPCASLPAEALARRIGPPADLLSLAAFLRAGSGKSGAIERSGMSATPSISRTQAPRVRSGQRPCKMMAGSKAADEAWLSFSEQGRGGGRSGRRLRPRGLKRAKSRLAAVCGNMARGPTSRKHGGYSLAFHRAILVRGAVGLRFWLYHMT